MALARAFLKPHFDDQNLPGLTPARDFERGRVEVSFPARLGGFGSDTPISCGPLSSVHRMDNYTVNPMDSYSELVRVQCHTRIGFTPWVGTAGRPLTLCVSVT